MKLGRTQQVANQLIKMRMILRNKTLMANMALMDLVAGLLEPLRMKTLMQILISQGMKPLQMGVLLQEKIK